MPLQTAATAGVADNTGVEFIVMFLVAVHPVAVTIYWIVATPPDRPVITPDALTVAIVGFSEVQLPVPPVDDHVVVADWQIVVSPPLIDGVLFVTVMVVELLQAPVVPVTV